MATSAQVGRNIQEPWIPSNQRIMQRCISWFTNLQRNNISSMSLAALPAVFRAFIPTLGGSFIDTWWRLHPVEEFSENKNA